MVDELRIHPHGVLIHGSCVSRDAATAFLSQDIRLVGYVGRQSVVSAMAPKRPEWHDMVPALASAFQRNAVIGDLRGSLRRAIADSASEVNLLLMDFVDERNGYLHFEDGSIITRSLELVRSGLLEQLGGEPKLVTFGSAAHLHAWSEAMGRLADLLQAHDLLRGTRIIKHKWALASVQGHTFPFDASKLDPRIVNKQLETYYSCATELGFQLIVVPDGLCLTDAGHQWGMAPYHYVDAFNAFIGTRVEEVLT